MLFVRALSLTPLILLLTGCMQESQVPGETSYPDLDRYMGEMKARPKGNIEPLPKFRPYEAFTYSASEKRSPFQLPIKAVRNLPGSSNVRPEGSRPRQYLEQFDIESFSMVGSIGNASGLWGLVRGEDGVHRVKVGDYIGRNHGRITYIDEKEVRLIEIIPAGPSHWVERPKVLRVNQ